MKTLKIKIITIAIALSVLLSSCGKDTCANACGITAPWSDTTTSIVNQVVPDQQNILSGGN